MEVFVTRQPIFDLYDRIAGYELLYRATPGAAQAPPTVSAEMSNRVILDAFLGIGLQRVTDGRPAFINCTRELLLSGNVEILDVRHVVIEVLESIEPDEQVVAACEHLASLGYRIALDDFAFEPEWEPLVRIAYVVKVDVLQWSYEELAARVAPLRGRDVLLLAEKVESSNVRRQCVELGFDLFQGYHFSQPELVTQRDLSVDEMRILELLNLMRDLNIPDAKIEDRVRADLSVSYKLIRMAHSAAIGGTGVQSVGHAIRLLGRDRLYRWLAMLMLSTIGDRRGIDEERVSTALLRARFCELIGQRTGNRRAAGALFLTGLFSLLDAIMGVPMEDILEHMDLEPSIRHALLDRSGVYGAVLATVEAYQFARWDELPRLASAIPVAPNDLARMYLESLDWCRKLRSSSEY